MSSSKDGLSRAAAAYLGTGQYFFKNKDIEVVSPSHNLEDN